MTSGYNNKAKRGFRNKRLECWFKCRLVEFQRNLGSAIANTIELGSLVDRWPLLSVGSEEKAVDRCIRKQYQVLPLSALHRVASARLQSGAGLSPEDWDSRRKRISSESTARCRIAFKHVSFPLVLMWNSVATDVSWRYVTTVGLCVVVEAAAVAALDNKNGCVCRVTQKFHSLSTSSVRLGLS